MWRMKHVTAGYHLYMGSTVETWYFSYYKSLNFGTGEGSGLHTRGTYIYIWRAVTEDLLRKLTRSLSNKMPFPLLCSCMITDKWHVAGYHWALLHYHFIIRWNMVPNYRYALENTDFIISLRLYVIKICTQEVKMQT